MNRHNNARTTVYSRELIIDRVLRQGQAPALVAAALGISERTVYKWLARYRAEGTAGLHDRSSRPEYSPKALPAHLVDAIVHLRKTYRMTARAIAAALNLARSTVARILGHHGIGKISDLTPKEKPRRYERAAPGDLVHIDIKKIGRIGGIGKRFTGGIRKNYGQREKGWQYIHAAIDDHSRLAYVEVLDNETARTSAGFLIRALRFFRRHSIRVHRVMTDNGPGYISRYYAKIMGWLKIKHKRTRYYTPKTNGKVERFIKTLLAEWAYVRPYTSSNERQNALKPFLDFYNTKREHGGIGYQTPISRCPPNEQPV